jgi:hypothetical protein
MREAIDAGTDLGHQSGRDGGVERAQDPDGLRANASASSGTANSVPTTAPRASVSPTSAGSCATRRATTSRTVGGAGSASTVSALEQVEPALLHEPAHRLGEEEGVAAGMTEERVHGGRRRLAAARGDVGADGVGGQAVQRHAPRGGRTRDLRQRGVERPARHDGLETMGRDDEQGQPADVRGEELEQRERGAVGPVDVLEDEHRRLRPHALREPGDDGVGLLEPRDLGGIGRVECRKLAPRGHAAQDLPPRPELRRAVHRVALPEMRRDAGG